MNLQEISTTLLAFLGEERASSSLCLLPAEDTHQHWSHGSSSLITGQWLPYSKSLLVRSAGTAPQAGRGASGDQRALHHKLGEGPSGRWAQKSCSKFPAVFFLRALHRKLGEGLLEDGPRSRAVSFQLFSFCVCVSVPCCTPALLSDFCDTFCLSPNFQFNIWLH